MQDLQNGRCYSAHDDIIIVLSMLSSTVNIPHAPDIIMVIVSDLGPVYTSNPVSLRIATWN
jgi:hypothetical protein